MNWIFLLLAGLFEMLGVVSINKVNRDRNWRSFAMLIVTFGASFLFLTLAMQTLAMSTAYAIWTGIGASGGAILSMVLYKEPRNAQQLIYIVLVLGSAIGLKLVS